MLLDFKSIKRTVDAKISLEKGGTREQFIDLILAFMFATKY
jgi:hypothetical protein